MPLSAVTLYLSLWAGAGAVGLAAESRPAEHVDAPPIAICREPGRYVSFPDVRRIGPHRLLCVFRDATFPARVQHIEPDARIVACVSDDDGRHWSRPAVLYDDPACQNDPSFAVLRDGRLLLTFFNWRGLQATTAPGESSPFARRVNHGAWGSWAEHEGVFLLGGRADPLEWEPHAVHVCGSPKVLRATSARVLQTAGGTLLLPIYGRSPDKPVDQAYVLRSADGGRTFGREILIAKDPAGKVAMQEPALIETCPGHILAVMRTANAGDHLYATRSADEGRTWAAPVPTDVIGHPPDLLMLPDRGILLARGYRHAPFGVRACVSRDAGVTWGPEIVIAAGGAHGDLGYPSLCLTDDGHVLVAYYMNGPQTRDRWIEARRLPLSFFQDR